MARARINRHLSPDQERSVKYLQSALFKWRSADLAHRINMTQKEIWQIFCTYFEDGHAISESTLSSQLIGRQMPGIDSVWAWIRFADLDVIETLEIFHRPMPLNFPIYYEYICRVSEQEHWEDREQILQQLLPLKDLPEWQHPTMQSHWTVQLALELLRMQSLSLHEIAYYLVKLVQGYQALPHLLMGS